MVMINIVFSLNDYLGIAGCLVLSRVIRVKYEDGVLKPLDKVDASEGEILVVRILKRELAEKVFGSLRVDKRALEEALREAEDEIGVY